MKKVVEMQVSGGKIRGEWLRIPQTHSIRPTTSLVKQAIFSILASTVNDWHRILDLYAGSGALGVEALSRQSDWADFVEQNQKCCGAIKYNLEKAGFSDKAHVYCCKVNKAITFLNNKYDVIFMDPPYSDSSISNMLIRLADSRLVKDDSIIVLCHANRLPLNTSGGGLQLIKERRYGDTLVSIYRKETN
jgi:16S rRNA (guanine(966)-N(2))-methyltransferase RsmD